MRVDMTLTSVITTRKKVYTVANRNLTSPSRYLTGLLLKNLLLLKNANKFSIFAPLGLIVTFKIEK
jgi:hypothetical protein